MVKAVKVYFGDGTERTFKTLTLCVSTLSQEEYRFKFDSDSEPLKIDDKRIRNWINNISHPSYGVQCTVDKHDRRGSIVKFAWG